MEEATIPYEKLEVLGITKEQLKDSDKNSLLEGKKTSLLDFSIENTPQNKKLLESEKVDFKIDDNNIHFSGRIQLQKYMLVENTTENKNELDKAKIKFEDIGNNKLKIDPIARNILIGTVVIVSPITALALLLIPKRTELKNDNSLNLNKEDLKKLERGEIVYKKGKEGEKLHQVDKDTNSIMSVDVNSIKIPDRIANNKLSPLNKEALKKGGEISLKKGEKARLNLNEPNGISIKDANGKKISYDRTEAINVDDNKRSQKAKSDRSFKMKF